MFSKYIKAALILLFSSLPLMADDMMIDDFKQAPETRWRFFADTVMGGVSSGSLRFASDSDPSFARLAGRVSTENNGGFIQMRVALPQGAPAGSEGVRLVVRGNDQRYFIHLRTIGSMLPWQYYQSGFDTSGAWTEIRLPFSSFKPSGGMLRRAPRAGGLKSLGIVAYGRDHDAEIDVREVGFY